MQALGNAVSFVTGYALSSSCAEMPCSARFRASGRSFKLSILVHSASLEEVNGLGVVHTTRPYVGVAVGDRMKETELGDWSDEKSQWCFKEILTVEVCSEEELFVFVSSLTHYNLYVASVAVSSIRIGEVCIRVMSILERLKMEDRDLEGMVYATSVLPFTLTKEGRVSGRVYLSFETRALPHFVRGSDTVHYCGLGGLSVHHFSSNPKQDKDAPTDVLGRNSHINVNSTQPQLYSVQPQVPSRNWSRGHLYG